MQDGARFFAYTTWVLMISLAIIVFTNRFLVYITDPGLTGLLVLLGFGFIYLNLSYAVTRRFIRKTYHPTSLHYVLALLVYLPPALWIIIVNDQLQGSRFILLSVLAFACGLGSIYGHKSGLKKQKELIEKLKAEQLAANESNG
jgi:hypothetical protein